MTRLKEGSLFSGYNGLGLGLSQVLDTELAWVSDIDKGACKILAHRYPDVPNHGDLTQIDWSAVEPVDIITGGFPCQDLSHAGKGAGLKSGTRSGLWSYMCEAIDIIRPRLVVAENVRGLLSAEALRPVEPCPWCVGDEPELDMRALGAVLADLADIGYDTSWYGLRAGRPVPIDNITHVGASHGRFRVFLAAYPFGGRLDWWARKPLGKSLVGAATAGSRPHLLPTPRTSDSNGPGSHGDGGLDLRTAVTLLPTPMVGSTSPAAHSQISGQFRDAMDAALARFGDFATGIARWESVIDRAAPSPTEPTGKGGAQRLSPRFTEWMMGLPDGWITEVPGITRNEALKACGNGVVPQQAAAAIRRLLAVTEVAA